MLSEADLITSICTRIATLTIIQDMDGCESKPRKEFSPIFGPLPHIKEIPTSFHARICLKDPHRKIQSCLYPFPCRYTKAWA
jgi:hypothetical protein